MKEQYNERTELMSELHTMRNRLLGELGEVDMAIMREQHSFEAKSNKTVTPETRELLLQQRPRPLWSSKLYQEQAFSQDDVKQSSAPVDKVMQRYVETFTIDKEEKDPKPPYEYLIQ